MHLSTEQIFLGLNLALDEATLLGVEVRPTGALPLRHWPRATEHSYVVPGEEGFERVLHIRLWFL